MPEMLTSVESIRMPAVIGFPESTLGRLTGNAVGLILTRFVPTGLPVSVTWSLMTTCSS